MPASPVVSPGEVVYFDPKRNHHGEKRKRTMNKSNLLFDPYVLVFFFASSASFAAFAAITYFIL